MSIKDGPVCNKSLVILKIKRAAAEEINIYTVMDDLEICKSRRMGWFQRWSAYHKGSFTNYVYKTR